MPEAANSTVSDRAVRAHQWIQALSELPERCAGTTSEYQAAQYVSDWMQALGVHDVAFVPVRSVPRAGVVLALHTGLAALGCLWGGLPGALLAGVALWSFRSELRHAQPRLSRLLQPSDAVNVVGRVGPEAPARRVVLSAHIDAAQAGWLFAPQLADLFASMSRGRQRNGAHPPGPHALNELLLLAALLLALAGWCGAHGLLFGLAWSVVTGGLLLACGLGLQWAWSPATPGANDNASAVAAMLGCAERLRTSLPADVQLVLVGTGAEEVGCKGMHAFVEQHREWPAQHTYFVNFECVGGGALHFIRNEGVLGKVVYPPTLNEVARRIAASGSFGEVTPTDLLAGTDGHVPAAYGYPALSLISLEPNGVPRNYHRPNDTVDAIDISMVLRAGDFGAAVALAALNGAADAIKAVEFA